MNFLDVGVVLMVLLNLIFSGIILVHGKRQAKEIFYALTTVFASIWSLAVLLVTRSGVSPGLFQLGLTVHYIGGNFAYLSVFWFSLFYPRRRTDSLAIPLVITFLNVWVQILVFVPHFLFRSVTVAPVLSERIVFNPIGYGIFVIFLSTIYVLDEVNLIASYRRSINSAERKGLGHLIVGSSLAGFFGIFLNLILPWLGNFDLFVAGPIFVTVAFVGVSIYILLKFKFFDLKVVAAEVFVIILVLTLIVRLIADVEVPERILDSVLVLFSLIFGYSLIRSVLREVRIREEMQRLATELATANAELKRLDAAKSEFISIASHQLRAPLTVIKGYVSLLLEGTLGAVTERTRESMRKVMISAEQLVRLIGDMLDLSRIEAGRLKYNFQPLAFDGVVAEVVQELEVNARQKGLAFSYENRNTAKRTITGDADKLREVVFNLIDNAIRYTATGRVRVELYPETVASREWLTLTVQDTGIGIDASEKQRLFTKFGRTEEAKRIRADGMGLGLYLVKKIADDHGGRAGADSPGVGQGSTFAVSFPVTR